MAHETEHFWFCTSCEDWTDIAPCECGGRHDEILVLPAKVAVDEQDIESGRWPTVDELDWEELVDAA